MAGKEKSVFLQQRYRIGMEHADGKRKKKEGKGMYQQMIAVTNRHILWKEESDFEPDFEPGTESWRQYLEQISWIAARRPKAVVLREKDLKTELYIKLAEEVLEICRKQETELILHGFPEAADALQYRKLHLPLVVLRKLEQREKYEKIGTSVHSLEDVREAKRLGADYVFAGNIYETDCKKGLPGRGLPFLEEICCYGRENGLLVYAIGGITPERLPEICRAGADGGCMMSGFMKRRHA